MIRLLNGTPKDFIEIREITKTLIEDANPSVKSGVMGRLGRMYRDGKGVEKDLDKAIEWMRKAAKRNTVWESELINMLWKRGTPDDLAELKSVVENGAAEGKAYAFLWIGRMYRDGKGVEKDLDQAIEWMRRAAEEKYGWNP